MRSLLLLLLALPATAAPLSDGALVDVAGVPTPLPLLGTDITARVQGDLATVEVVQTFQNPHDQPMHARYVFPLPVDAAVYAMTFENGRRVIEGEIRRKHEADQDFAEAKAKGQQAALLTQQRPNVFTQQVAHLLPGEPLKVTLRYAHPVPRVDGDYRFHVPLVVGPRYTPRADDAGAPVVGPPQPVFAAGGLDPRVRVALHLDAGTPVTWIDSPSHAVDVRADGPERRVITPIAPKVKDDQDFEVRYRLAAEQPAVGVTAYRGVDDGVVSLLIEPPRAAAPADITPREVVFVLDCSGSMAGVPLEASKRFVRQMMDGLRPTDRVRIVRFASDADELKGVPVPATPENLRYARAYLDTLRGGGGTEMTTGVEAAFAPPLPDGHLRIVVFLTDGYIGNENAVLGLLDRLRGDARLFALGIGNATNRYLLEGMGRVGRGTATIVRPDEDVEYAADRLVEALAAPYLTDVTIDWGKAPVREATPAEVPDVFLGRSVRVLARYTRPGRYPITVRGEVGGKRVALPVTLDLPAHAPTAEALPLTWARQQIADRMHTHDRPGQREDLRDALKEEVVTLSLKHRVLSRWTAFLAIDKTPVVDAPGAVTEQPVPVSPPEGVPGAAYGNGFAGHAAPEPATWAALLLLALMGAVVLRRRADA